MKVKNVSAGGGSGGAVKWSVLDFIFKDVVVASPTHFRKKSALKTYGAEAMLSPSAQQSFLRDAHGMPSEDSYRLSAIFKFIQYLPQYLASFDFRAKHSFGI